MVNMHTYIFAYLSQLIWTFDVVMFLWRTDFHLWAAAVYKHVWVESKTLTVSVPGPFYTCVFEML